MQTLTNNPNPSLVPTTLEKVKLPLLPIEDIEKLDYLLSCMKQRQTEFVDVYSVCKEKWDDHPLLYLYFAEYLKKNHLTSVQDQADSMRYSWNQKITTLGLSIDGFKSEYTRQQPAIQEIFSYRFITSFAIHYIVPLSMLIPLLKQ